jgi:glycosyltransferase involved in cell wall biosynthesis
VTEELTAQPVEWPTEAAEPASRFQLSIIAPTRNEEQNVTTFVRRVSAALVGVPVELVIVDDSDDQTAAVVTELSDSSTIPVRLVHRRAGERVGGLSGAVVAGLRYAQAPWAVVMDADLQHPPEMLRQVLAATEKGNLDVVVATRYVGTKNEDGRDGFAGRRRQLISRMCTALARGIFPRRLRSTTDPMSGFFAVRLGAIDTALLRPRGFKVLFELLVRCGPLRVREVPYRFAGRNAGQSKATIGEGMRFLSQLLLLRLWLLGRQPRAQLTRAFAFGLVGASGIAVNSLALWAFADPRTLHWNYLFGSVLATQFSSTWNFGWTERYVFAGPKRSTMPRRFVQFLLLNNATLLLRVPLLAVAVSVFGLHYLVGNVIVITLMFATRFLVADRLIFKKRPSATAVPALPVDRTAPNLYASAECKGAPVQRILELVADDDAEAVTRNVWRSHLPYRYDIFGLVHVGSQVELSELDYFRAQSLGHDFDIEVRVGDVGRGVHRRIVLSRAVDGGVVSYEEQLGRLGANFRLEIGDRIRLTVSPLLARSPHVAYTNVIEALLRYVLVERDRVLLHSACVDLGGVGVMLSAKTDTGKTGTILRMLRDHGARFLSDDMTILDPDAHAYCYPKPLTISHHTLRAVEPGELSRREWQRLRLQSRLHSKEGRQWGMRLGTMNVPIMSMNSLTQMVVPPPKHAVDRLVACDVVRDVQVRDLFIIERGAPTLEEIDSATALEELIANTDDAYGFPPFRYFAPVLVLDGDDYDKLRIKERNLLARAVDKIEVRRLASDNFGWPDEISRILAERRAATAIVEPEEHPSDGTASTNGKRGSNGNGAGEHHVIDLTATEPFVPTGTTRPRRKSQPR